ncbi:MAG: PIN domain-containing protein [Acidobacteriaceae bacterium]
MGLILDSSIVIAAERRGDSVPRLLSQVAASAGNQHAVLSSVGLTELAHAVYRAQTPVARERRENFLGQLLLDMEVVPYTKDTALLAGRLDGEQRACGVTIPSVDLMIGATALEYGYSLVTVNLRHFQLIPGLNVVSL